MLQVNLVVLSHSCFDVLFSCWRWGSVGRAAKSHGLAMSHLVLLLTSWSYKLPCKVENTSVSINLKLWKFYPCRFYWYISDQATSVFKLPCKTSRCVCGSVGGWVVQDCSALGPFHVRH